MFLKGGRFAIYQTLVIKVVEVLIQEFAFYDGLCNCYYSLTMLVGVMRERIDGIGIGMMDKLYPSIWFKKSKDG